MINHNKNAWRLVLPFEILMIIKTVFAYDASSINVSNSLPDAACSVKGGGGHWVWVITWVCCYFNV